MTLEEKKAIINRNYAINSQKTPRTRRMAYARAHAGDVIVTDPELIARMKYYIPGYDPANP